MTESNIVLTVWALIPQVGSTTDNCILLNSTVLQLFSIFLWYCNVLLFSIFNLYFLYTSSLQNQFKFYSFVKYLKSSTKSAQTQIWTSVTLFQTLISFFFYFHQASSFLWGLWAILQSRFSSIDFDFQRFVQRLTKTFKTPTTQSIILHKQCSSFLKCPGWDVPSIKNMLSSLVF